MRKKLKALRLIALVLVAATSILSLSSCMYLLADGESQYMTEEEVRDLIAGNMSGDVSIGEVKDYDITINASGDRNLMAATKGVLSAVSVRCKFNVTTGFGSQTTTATSAGAGVIYRLNKTEGDAYIITNYHVVYEARSKTANRISNNISVYLYGMEDESYAIPATFVGGSMAEDLAVLRVEDSRVLAESNAMEVSFADSDEISILDTAIAIGNPEGEGISATVGCINVDSEEIQMYAADGVTRINLRLLRIDTAVNSGNSGGGLFDDSGRLIGIVNAKISADGIDNIGYAIPSNIVKAVVDNIIHYCDSTTAENPYKYIIGITMDKSAMYTVFDEETGRVHKREEVIIASVADGSIAASNFAVGDILKSITIDGVKYEINRMFQITDRMYSVYENSTVIIEIVRDGAPLTLEISFAGRTPERVS
jgi:serine protease Do